MRYKDLPEVPNGRFLHCPECQARYSASRGDYWLADPQAVIRCGEDSTPLELCRERGPVRVKA